MVSFLCLALGLRFPLTDRDKVQCVCLDQRVKMQIPSTAYWSCEYIIYIQYIYIYNTEHYALIIPSCHRHVFCLALKRVGDWRLYVQGCSYTQPTSLVIDQCVCFLRCHVCVLVTLLGECEMKFMPQGRDIAC